MGRLETYYRREDGRYLIELKLTDLQRLFSVLDPAPFRERDLNAETDAWLQSAVGEFPDTTPLKMVIYLPADGLHQHDAEPTQQAIHNYYRYRAECDRRQLLDKLREGRFTLLIGLGFLVSCLLARAWLGKTEPGSLLAIVSEGLLISGWVAMWRPVQIFLYDWWPIRRQLRLHKKLAGMPVELRPQ